MKCEHCGSSNIEDRGSFWGGEHVYECMDCHKGGTLIFPLEEISEEDKAGPDWGVLSEEEFREKWGHVFCDAEISEFYSRSENKEEEEDDLTLSSDEFAEKEDWGDDSDIPF